MVRFGDSFAPLAWSPESLEVKQKLKRKQRAPLSLKWSFRSCHEEVTSACGWPWGLEQPHKSLPGAGLSCSSSSTGNHRGPATHSTCAPSCKRRRAHGLCTRLPREQQPKVDLINKQEYAPVIHMQKQQDSLG